MKFRQILLAVLCVFNAVGALGQTWQWAGCAVHTGETRGADVATDRAGNVYVTGYFKGQMGLGGFQLTSAGAEDIFIAKYAANGQVVWAKRFGGTGEDIGTSVAVDSKGDIVLAGSFSDTVAFGGGGLLASNGLADVFVAKLDTGGTVLWATSGGGANVDYVSGGIYGSAGGLSIGIDDNIMITGLFWSPVAVFGFTSILCTPGGDDAYMVKYGADGSLIWAKSVGNGQISGSGPGSGKMAIDVSVVATDKSFIMSGTFEDPYQYFDSVKVTSVSNGLVGGNLFVARFDSNAHLLWIRHAGGLNQSTNTGASVSGGANTVDKYGNVYTSGTYDNCKLKFDDPAMIPLPMASRDIFIIKYSKDGIFRWVKTIGGLGSGYDRRMITDTAGNLYVTGGFSGQMIANSDTIQSAGALNAYIIKYDSSGNVLWTKTAGGTAYALGVGIVLNDAGDIYSTGYFSGTQADFGGNSIFNTAGGYDMYLAKLSQPPLSIEETQAVRATVNIIPNPNTGNCSVEFPAKSYQQMVVTDAAGREVARQQIASYQNRLNVILPETASGLYILRLQGKADVANAKIMVVK